jgi:hypothetical protein
MQFISWDNMLGRAWMVIRWTHTPSGLILLHTKYVADNNNNIVIIIVIVVRKNLLPK